MGIIKIGTDNLRRIFTTDEGETSLWSTKCYVSVIDLAIKHKIGLISGLAFGTKFWIVIHCPLQKWKTVNPSSPKSSWFNNHRPWLHFGCCHRTAQLENCSCNTMMCSCQRSSKYSCFQIRNPRQPWWANELAESVSVGKLERCED